MSFSLNAKIEMCNIRHNSPAGMKAEGYAFLLFGKSFNRDSISFKTENIYAAQRYADLLAANSGVFVDIIRGKNRINAKTTIVTVNVPDESQRIRILKDFGHDVIENNSYVSEITEISESNPQPYIQKIEADGSLYDTPVKIITGNIAPGTEPDFIRGAFLCCGTISDPAKEYHLELSTGNPVLCKYITEILAQWGLPAKIIMRKGLYIIYYKESEQIEDFLTLTGAVNSSMELMNIKIVKDIRNRANRITNCETANISKTVAASSYQVEAINYIKKHMGLNYLPDELREIAQLRLDNPEMSLRELGENLSPPLSRSGVNHRLKRICEYYQKLLKHN